MKKSPQRFILFVLAGFVALWLGYALSGMLSKPQPEQPPKLVELLNGTALIGQEKPLLPFNLIGKGNQPFTLDNFKGYWSYVFFGYTHCPDICPTTLQVMNQTLQQLSPDEAQAVFISVDPERDTIEKIKSYVEYFNPDMLGATGDPEVINKLTRHIGIIYQRVENPASKENYLVDHSASILLINPRGELAAVLSPPFDPKNLAADLRTVKQLTMGR